MATAVKSSQSAPVVSDPTAPAGREGASFLSRVPAGFWLLAPAILFLALFFIFPLMKLVAISLPTRRPLT